eukprot:PhM_4_TR13643/c0_g1_i2/m.67544
MTIVEQSLETNNNNTTSSSSSSSVSSHFLRRNLPPPPPLQVVHQQQQQQQAAAATSAAPAAAAAVPIFVVVPNADSSTGTQSVASPLIVPSPLLLGPAVVDHTQVAVLPPGSPPTPAAAAVPILGPHNDILVEYGDSDGCRAAAAC